MARSEKGNQVESRLQFRVVDGQVENDLILTLAIVAEVEEEFSRVKLDPLS